LNEPVAANERGRSQRSGERGQRTSASSKGPVVSELQVKCQRRIIRKDERSSTSTDGLYTTSIKSWSNHNYSLLADLNRPST
jgi:hypothetical protein